MEIVSKTYDQPVWGDNVKSHILVNIKTEMEDGQIMIQSAAVTRDESNPDWIAIVKEHGEDGIQANTEVMLEKSKNNIVEQAAAQKEQKKTQKERTSQERLFDAKLAIFEIEDIKNSKNRIPFGVELLQKHKRDSWIVFTENKKQAKEFNKIINKKGYKSAIYNTDLDNNEREENLNNFKSGNLNVLVSCTALDEGFDMPEADGAMILSASSSKRQRIQRMGRVLRITANKENALIVTVYSSNTEYVKLKEESNRYQLENVPIRWQKMK